MESSSDMVAFPLLLTPVDSNYRACTIPYRFPSDNPRKPTPTELAWIDLFANSVPSFRFVLYFNFMHLWLPFRNSCSNYEHSNFGGAFSWVCASTLHLSFLWCFIRDGWSSLLFSVASFLACWTNIWDRDTGLLSFFSRLEWLSSSLSDCWLLGPSSTSSTLMKWPLKRL